MNNLYRIRLTAKTIFTFLVSITAIFSILSIMASQSGNKDKVAILTWWGYLSDQHAIKQLELKCNTKIEVREYMTIEDLIGITSKFEYDIYIYPWGYHDNIKKNLPSSDADLSRFSHEYTPEIRSRFQRADMPKNTVIFQEAVRMFLYDSNIFNDLQALNPKEMIQASDFGAVYFMNEIKQMNWFLSQIGENNLSDNWRYLYESFLANKNWHPVVTKGIYFSNFIPEYLNNNILIGLIDSGELLNPNINWEKTNKLLSNRSLEFGIHKRLSQISTDVLSVRSDEPEDVCVAKEMSSRDFLNWVTETSFYFNPYGDIPNNINPSFVKFAEQYYEMADQLILLDEHLTSYEVPDIAKSIWSSIKKCTNEKLCTDSF